MRRATLIILALLLIPSFALAREVGKITSLQGTVDILRDGKPPAVEAKVNMPVYERDLIRTKTDSKAEITMIDGTVLRVAPRSRVDISEYFIDERTVKATIGLPRGKVGAYVAQDTSKKISIDPKANRFEIKTPVAVAGVRGTVPIVSHRANITTVLVLTGRVYVYNPRIPERVVDVLPGQFTIVRETQPPAPPQPAPPREQERDIRDITIAKKEDEAPQTADTTPPPTPTPLPSPPPATPPVTDVTPTETPATPVFIETKEAALELRQVEIQATSPAFTVTETVTQVATITRTQEKQTQTPPVTETIPQVVQQQPPPPPPQPEPPTPSPQPPTPPPQPEPQPPQPPSPPQPEPEPPTPPTPPQPEPPPPPTPPSPPTPPTPPPPPTPPQPEPEPEPSPPPPEPPTPPPPPPSPPPTSPQQYSISVNFVKAVPGTVNLVYSVTSSDGRPLSGVSYRIYNGTSWTDWSQYTTLTDSKITVPVTASTQTGYRIEFKAVDQNGIESSNNPSHPTNGLLYALFKGFSGYIGNMTSTTTGKVATISGPTIHQDDLNKGVFTLNPTQGSEPQFNSTIQGGGGNFTQGFWALRAQGGTGTGNTGTFTSSRFVLLTPQSLYLTPGSGYGLTATLNDAGKITNLTSQPSVREYPLGFSAKIEGAFHDFINNKVDEISGTNYANFFHGVSDDFTYPSTDPASTKSYSVGSVSLNQGIWWGNWTRNLCCSNTELRGFAAGYLKDSSDFDYMMYGFYSDSQGKNLGLVIGTKNTGTNTFLDQVKILDIEPQLTFKKVSGPFSQPVTNWWSDYIGGSYQGFFTDGSGTLTIGMKDINTTSYGKISSATLSPRHGTQGAIEPWGVFGIELGGTHQAQNPTGFLLEFSGSNWDNRDASALTPDYWVGTIVNGNIYDRRMSGTFSGKFMTPTHYGTMSGRMLGELKSDRWVGVVLGEYGTENLVQLGSVHFSDIPIYRNNLSIDLKDDSGTQSANLNAYIGTTSNTTVSAPLYSIGLVPQNQKQNITLDPGTSSSPGTGYVWLSSPTDTLSGSNPSYTLIAGGRLVPYQSQSGMVYALESRVVGIDGIPPSNIFEGTLSSTAQGHGVLTLERAFSAQGERSKFAYIYGLAGVPGNYHLSPAYHIENSNITGFNLQNSPSTNIRLIPAFFGIGGFALGGSYTSVTKPWYYTFTTSISETGISGTFGGLTTGQVWDSDFNGLKNVIDGKTYGYYSFLDSSTAKTGIFVGDTLGTFTSSQWQNITLGKFISRDVLFNPNIQSSLQQLGIPTVEVGSVNLSGSNTCSSDCITSLTLNNVKFLSPASGTAPVVWATQGDLTGSYTGTIGSGSSILLSGHSTSSSINNLKFEITSWNNPTGKWEAKLYPNSVTPTFSGSVSTYSIQDMRGVAAGDIGSSGNFTGSAAGVVLAGTSGSGGTAPVITNFSLASIEPSSVKLKYNLTADQPVIAGYKVIEQGLQEPDTATYPSGQNYAQTQTIEIPISFTTSPKNVSIKLYAKNNQGLESQPQQDPQTGYLSIYREPYYSYIGTIYSGSSSTSVDVTTSAVAAAKGRNKGVLKINLTQPLQFSERIEGKGMYSGYGFWYLSANNGNLEQGKFANFEYGHLTTNAYYFRAGDGSLNFEKAENTIVSLTSEPTLTVVPISKSLNVTGKIYDYSFTGNSGTIEALRGFSGFNLGNSFYSVGTLPNDLALQDGKSYIWLDHTTTGHYGIGVISPYVESSTYKGHHIGGRVYGILDNNSGLYKGVSEEANLNVLSTAKAFNKRGSIEGVLNEAVSAQGSLQGQFENQIAHFASSINGLNLSNGRYDFMLPETNYGLGMYAITGNYGNEPTTDWYIEKEFELTTTKRFGAVTLGSAWSNIYQEGTQNGIKDQIRGKSFGYFYDIATTTPITGIFVGETVGTFNPTDKKWQTATVGAFIETNTFLSATQDQNKKAQLASLGVPTVEVGTASFGYQNDSCSENCFSSVQLNDVKFFATQSGQRPLIWATSSVSGSFKGTPEQSTTLNANNGATGAVTFERAYWQDGKWSARVYTGSGQSVTLEGHQAIQMRGVAAGTINGNNFSGTAAGYAR